MIKLNDFRDLLPDEFSSISDEDIQSMLTFFHKIAFVCLQLNKEKFALEWISSWNDEESEYTNSVYDTPNSDDSHKSWWTSQTTQDDCERLK